MANKGGIRDSVRKRAGAPDKETQLANKLAKARLQIQELKVKLKANTVKVNGQLIENYQLYIDVLHDIALGQNEAGKDATPAQRISAADKLIKMINDIKSEMEEEVRVTNGEHEQEVPEVQSDKEEEEEEPESAALISF